MVIYSLKKALEIIDKPAIEQFAIQLDTGIIGSRQSSTMSKMGGSYIRMVFVLRGTETISGQTLQPSDSNRLGSAIRVYP
jgi:hypothetical protein